MKSNKIYFRKCVDWDKKSRSRDRAKAPYKTNVPYRCVTKCPHYGAERDIARFVGSTICQKCRFNKETEEDFVRCTHE